MVEETRHAAEGNRWWEGDPLTEDEVEMTGLESRPEYLADTIAGAHGVSEFEWQCERHVKALEDDAESFAKELLTSSDHCVRLAAARSVWWLPEVELRISRSDLCDGFEAETIRLAEVIREYASCGMDGEMKVFALYSPGAAMSGFEETIGPELDLEFTMTWRVGPGPSAGAI